MSLLELKHIYKIYGELHALDDVSLKVEKGEWVSIMGPSGSGKSTMMNIIGCMDKPSKGEVLLDGVDIAKESAKNLTAIRRDKIGLIFQQFHLVNYLTAVENVMLAQYYHSLPDEKTKRKRWKPLTVWGLPTVPTTCRASFRAVSSRECAWQERLSITRRSSLLMSRPVTLTKPTRRSSLTCSTSSMTKARL